MIALKMNVLKTADHYSLILIVRCIKLKLKMLMTILLKRRKC